MSIDVSSAQAVEVGYDEFCGALASHDLQALWSLQRKLMPDVPIPSTLPGSGSGTPCFRSRSAPARSSRSSGAATAACWLSRTPGSTGSRSRA